MFPILSFCHALLRLITPPKLSSSDSEKCAFWQPCQVTVNIRVCCIRSFATNKFLRLYCLLTLTRNFWLQWSFLLLLHCTCRFKHVTSSLPLRGKSCKKCSSPFIFDRYWAGDETIITLSTRFQMAGSEKKILIKICRDVSTRRGWTIDHARWLEATIIFLRLTDNFLKESL